MEILDSDGLKREASWLGMSLFKSLRTLVGILLGATPLWTSKEEIMPENSI